MILKELNKSLMTMETQCHQMVSKPTKDQLQVLIFNKMGHIKTSKLIMPHNLIEWNYNNIELTDSFK